MKIKNVSISMVSILWLIFYYVIAQYLPNSYCSIKPIGRISNYLRVLCCKHIFLKCGNIRTINRKVQFGSGRRIEMGDDSGIGARTQIPSDTIIGKNVILSRDCFILNCNHRYERVDIPIVNQGFKEAKRTIIEDDCWIGLGTLMTPGRIVKKGTIVAMGSVLTKDFPEYSIVGGNPAKLIKQRK